MRLQACPDRQIGRVIFKIYFSIHLYASLNKTDMFTFPHSLKSLSNKVAEHLVLFVSGVAEPDQFAHDCRFLQSGNKTR